jgi:hypothetical protein
MGDVLDHQRILLVCLDGGELGEETAGIFGSLLVARLWQEIRRRTIRLPVGVYLDEYQSLIGTTVDLGEVLAQARGFGVGVTLGFQHAGQLGPQLKASTFANARTKVIFQTSADDAGQMARQLGGGLTADDLMGLSAHHAYLAACVGSEVLPPASLSTLPPPAPLGTLACVREASRSRYARDRASVETEIAARRDTTDGNGTVGRRRRAS